jgi:carbon starvation protein CstA
VSIPIFLVAFFFCKVDFSKAWTFLGISNQILAAIVLWTGAAYLINKGKKHLMCSLPAAFLTYVCVSYLLVAPHDKAGLHLSPELGNYIGLAVAVILFAFCLIKGRKARGNCEAMQDTSCE